MELNMEVTIKNIHDENEKLQVSLEDTQDNCRRLQEEKKLLEAALDQQKTLHRMYVEEVTATEELRIAEFDKVKNNYISEQQSLVKVNRQLQKDVEFYKQESENTDSLREKHILLEKAIEKEKKFHRQYVDEGKANEAIRIRDCNKERRDFVNEIKALKKINSQLTTDAAFYKKAYENLEIVKSVSESKRSRRASEAESVSYHLPSKVSNEKRLYEENKKLQSKIVELSSTVTNLKAKNRQLTNFKNKIESKKTKFEKDSEELNRLMDTSKTCNEQKYTADVLEMLISLAKNQK